MSPPPSSMSTPCPDENALAGFASGALPAPQVSLLEAHLDGCADCRALVGAVAADASVRDRPRSADAPTCLETGETTELEEPGAALALPKPGTRLGPYVLRELSGMGGMGVVYAAEDTRLGRRVALKLLRPAREGSEQERRERLLREAKAMARLAHPNVLPLFDLGSSEGLDFLAMEWVEGTTLAGWLRERERPWRDVLSLFLEAGAGLAAAHRQGLVHRDFKPSNVLVGRDGRPRVMDFGIARWESPPREPVDEASGAEAVDPGDDSDATRTGLTRAGVSPGTPAYMSPEQRRGLTVDARSDQYSFCVALYEALHGERPLPEQRPGAPVSPGGGRRKSPRLPRHVRRALARGLASTPDARHPSMEALLSALRPRSASRNPAWVAALAVLVLLGVAYGASRGWEGRLAGEGGSSGKFADSEDVTLTRGERLRLVTSGVSRIAVGNPALVEVDPIEGNLQVTALAPGQTSLLTWSKEDDELKVYRLTILPAP
ncbi:protein kinase [Myxococcus stipitatus]|uniref:protein kinase domain-containing protein n=1 Tax=Myxococcus stipitatus TaxID=83455 RepID=UPI001F27D9A8|nr:protein kinase [Myxococcus stipitatus]MCE9668523.1 protein kinase [Myxococcus stipitatus]